MGQPIAEYCLHKHRGLFHTEFNHPTLHSPGPGRPRQIDYAIISPKTRKITTAIECKWISESSYDKQRILNDVLRLECIHEHSLNARKFLIVAGIKDHFNRNFKELMFKGRKPFSKEIFSFSRATTTRENNTTLCQQDMAALYRGFCDAYDHGIPKTYCTDLIGYRTADDISVAVWEIKSRKRSERFRPHVSWGGGT